MFPSRRITTMGGDVFRDEYSLDFDGTNDYLDLGNTNNLGTGAFSFAFWIKADQWTSNYIISKRTSDNDRWFFVSNGSDQILFQCDVGGATKMNAVCSTILTSYENQWIHLAFTSSRDGTNNWYINGSYVNTDTDSNSEDWDNSASLYINRLDTNYGSAGSSNKISELVRYNVALSSSQVATIYNGREPYNHKEGVASANLQGWWRMGDGSEKSLGLKSLNYGELITTTKDKNMDSSNNWDVSSANWSVDGNSLDYDGSGGGSAALDQTYPAFIAGRRYEIKFNTSAGDTIITFKDGDGSNTLVAEATYSSGTKTATFVSPATTDGLMLTAGGSSAAFAIDWINIKEFHIYDMSDNSNDGKKVNMAAADFVGDAP